MKKVFICSTSRYPYGSPAAQRIQYISKMLMEAGLRVIVITNGENIKSEFNQEQRCFIHDGIPYNNVEARKGSLVGLLARARKTINIMKSHGAKQDDILLVCTAISFYGSELFSFAKSIGMVTVADKTEWFQKEQFRMRGLDPFYLLANWYFNKTILKADKIICISKLLKKHFEDENKEVFCLPIVTDAKDYPYIERTDFQKIKFIYPGFPGTKDDFPTMLHGLAMLPSEAISKLEFHLTKVTEDQIKGYLDNHSEFERIKSVFVYHGYMEYKELLELYNNTHFTLIVKPDNIVTVANFPSKVPELMACGVVPVITNKGDITNYLNEENAVFINICDAVSVRDALTAAISMDKEQISKASESARMCAETIFDYHCWVEPFTSFVLK